MGASPLPTKKSFSRKKFLMVFLLSPKNPYGNYGKNQNKVLNDPKAGLLQHCFQKSLTWIHFYIK